MVDDTHGLVIERAWYLGPWNFDNIGNSMLVVFELVTGENWPTIMDAGVNYVGPQQVARNNANPPAAIYVSLAAGAGAGAEAGVPAAAPARAAEAAASNLRAAQCAGGPRIC
jgi:hypothetical protein